MMSKTMPLISVITPSYNAVTTIGDTIASVIGQTYKNWEMVIVDDGSTDGTRELLTEALLLDSRIKVHVLEENSGAAIARNTALQHAAGRFVAFLDSDDRWKPDKLQKQLDFMQEHDYAFSFTAYEYMTQDGESLNRVVQAPECVTYKDMLKNTIVGCLTVMIDRAKTGPFQMPLLRSRQDLATWLSLLKQGITAYGLNENLADYRIGVKSLSSNKLKVSRRTWYVYREIEQLNVWKAMWYFTHYAANAMKKRVL